MDDSMQGEHERFEGQINRWGRRNLVQLAFVLGHLGSNESLGLHKNAALEPHSA